MLDIKVNASLQCCNCYNSISNDLPFTIATDHDKAEKLMLEKALAKGWSKASEFDAICPKCQTKEEADGMDESDRRELIVSLVKKQENDWWIERIVEHLPEVSQTKLLAALFKKLDPRAKCPQVEEVVKLTGSLQHHYVDSGYKEAHLIPALVSLLLELTEEKEEVES